MEKRRTRVRFAPSPTGPLHMGGVRTALYNYLYAKQNGGDFIIRIEDTDSQRFVPGAEQYIIEALSWCGIIPDEGVDMETGKVVEEKSEKHPHAPYRQSQRRGIYRKYAEQLVNAGWAYYAFDTAEELAAARSAAEAKGDTFIYNASTRESLRNSLNMSTEEVNKMLSERNDWTVRFKMPVGRVVAMDDMIRGHVEVNTDTLDDKVLWKKADELPTYHLANIVDDHLMEITEVIRGEEWLPSLPLHYLLYEAFGWTDTMPRFAHLPLLLKPVGNGKLSKRDGDKMGFPVFPLNWKNSEGETYHGYREDGYFPQAFVNLLAMLGWNPGTEQEIFSMKELIDAFSIDHVSKSGAKFNPDKAKWYNKEYLRMQDDETLACAFEPILAQKGVNVPHDYVLRVVSLIKERATFVSDFWDIASYLFIAPTEYCEKDVAKFWKEENYTLAFEIADIIYEKGVEAGEEEIKARQWPMGKIMNCIRLALVGASSGLGIADIYNLIGKEEFRHRLNTIKTKLNRNKKLKIGFAADHAGYLLGAPIEKYLNGRNEEIEFVNFGTFSNESVDYPDFAHKLAKAVENGELDLGIAACGTGNGMVITLNKYKGIRAGLAWNRDIARLAKEHNNANILVLPQRFISQREALECVEVWLDTEFSGGKHQRRIDKINL